MNKLVLILSVFLALTFTSHRGQAAYLSLGETGELIPAGTFLVGAAPQIITNDDGGFNVAAFLDAGWTDSFSSRFTLGAGEVDFYVSGSGKYIPFPDVGQQPAIGLKFGYWYAREGSANISTVHIAPMVSKKYNLDQGFLIPYAAYGLANTTVKSKSETGHQFFLGTEWKNPQLIDELSLIGEVALSLKDSTSSVSLFMALPFDNQKGFKRP